MDGAEYPRKLDGFTPSTAVNAPLTLILAASIGSVPVIPGCLATAARTPEDSENGATTSRSACFKSRNGATGTDLASREVMLTAAEAWATGTGMGRPLPS